LQGIADRKSPLEQLTGRQREILQLIAEGQNTKGIAEILKVSPKTVEYHRMKLMDCLNVHDIPGLVRFALRVGLIPQENAEPPKMYETENDISEKRRSELNALMNQRLASAVDLQTQMKQAHWNVKGPSFIGLHELFDKVDEAVESYVDMIAERIVQLGGIAEGTARVAASRSQLEEYPLTIADGLAHVEAVARALSTFGHEVRNTINEADELDDAGTADLFTEISRGIDKWLWFVEAHSQAPK
jgi:starvation-inducible DNA-binding protein